MVAIASLIGARAAIEDPKWRRVAALHLAPLLARHNSNMLDSALAGVTTAHLCPASLRLF